MPKSKLLKLMLAVPLLALLGACAHAPEEAHNPLARWAPSPNHEARRPILIVIHATEQNSVAESLETLRTENSGGPVSAHYLIGRDGERYQLVADELRAWHAGGGRWGTITDVNNVSIGIELDNDGRSEFPAEQIDSLLVLLEDLCTRLYIPRTQIVAHADFAPTRKQDPGIRFPWRRLAQAGFGIWPAADAPPAPDGFDPWNALRLLGYPLVDRAATVRAFHRRFRGTETDVLDTEDLRILASLVQRAGGE
jgi:N-acetylmuramoyl-L-alanine amidase